MISKPVIYVVVNKGLSMTPGKLAAQVGHAVALVMSDYNHDQCSDLWLTQPHRWLIVLEATNGEQLYHLGEYLRERNVPNYRVIDEGVNEIQPFSVTAIGVGILDKDSEVAAYFSGLQMYRYEIPPKERQAICNVGWNDAIRHVRKTWWGRRVRISELCQSG